MDVSKNIYPSRIYTTKIYPIPVRIYPRKIYPIGFFSHKIKNFRMKVQSDLGVSHPKLKGTERFRSLQNVPVYTLHAEILFLLIRNTL